MGFRRAADSRKLLDTSAAAIAASGLLRLCRLLHDPIKGHFYWTDGAAHPALAVRNAPRRKGSRGGKAFCSGGVYHIHKNLGVNESVMWGEYFFVEALETVLHQLNG